MSYFISVNKLREMEPFNQDYSSNATPEEEVVLKENLQANGIIHPLVVTKVDGEYKIVKGNTRTKLIKELDDNGEWKYDDIPVTEISFEEALTRFISESFARKDYNPFQRGMFGVKHCAEGIDLSDQKGREELAAKVGSDREYVRQARELLKIDADFFYQNIFIEGQKIFKSQECSEFLKMWNDKTDDATIEIDGATKARSILNKMKQIVDSTNNLYREYQEVKEKNKVSVYGYVRTLYEEEAQAKKTIDKENGMTNQDIPTVATNQTMTLTRIQVPEQIQQKYDAIIDRFDKNLRKIGIVLDIIQEV